MRPLAPVEERPSVAVGRPAKVQYQQQPEPSAREVLGIAIANVLRLARLAAELNRKRGPCEPLESTLVNLRAAIESAATRCNSRGVSR
jgi:hypothetical protein